MNLISALVMSFPVAFNGMSLSRVPDCTHAPEASVQPYAATRLAFAARSRRISNEFVDALTLA